MTKKKRRWGGYAYAVGFSKDDRISLLEARVEALEEELQEYRDKEITHQRAP